MATQARGKSTPSVKHDTLVEEALNRAQRRVRLLDVSAAVVGFILFVLVFGIVMALADRWAGGLAAGTRQLTLAGFVLVSLIYLGRFLVWPLLRPVNPYYAALKVEETLPAAKNSVVNWLDLHGQPIPPAFRTAVASRAAKDLARADIDTAFSPRRLLILGIVTAAVFVVFALQLALGGSEFLARLRNVFAPFGSGRTDIRRTHIKLIEPKGGDVTVSVGRSVSFAAEITGYVPKTNRPDSARLLYRYHQEDPPEAKPLERDGNQWVTQMPAFQVHSGFWYRIAAGDNETPEHHVQVRATPLISEILVTYHFRTYLAWPDVTTREPNLEAPRGTEVTLLVRTNRLVREGKIDYTSEQGTTPIAGEPVGKDDPQALRFKFTLDPSGIYRIWFTSIEDERNTDPIPYKIRTTIDQPPQVEVLKPQDTKLPLNGVLRIEGRAVDDFGITGMTLRMQLNADHQLPPRPFREGKKEKFKLAGDTYPQTLDYQDFVELDRLRDKEGQPLKPGVLEYWLEATDACDYPPPGPNVGKSKVYKVFLTKPDAKDKNQAKAQEDARKQAKKEQQQFEKKQDDKLKEENKKAEQEQKERQEATKQANEQATKGDKDKGEQGDKGDKGEPKKPDGDQGNQPNKTPEQEREDKIEQKIKDQLEREENKGKDKGDGQPQPAGEGKGEGKKQEGQEKNEGESKPPPNNSGDAGSAKGEGKQGPDQKQNEGEQKGPGKDNGQNNNAQNGGNENPSNEKQPGQSKGEGKQGPGSNDKGEGKDEGKQDPEQKGNEGEGKGEGKKSPEQKNNEGQAKGEGKGKSGPEDRGSGKPGPGKTDEKGSAKSGPDQPQPSGEGKGAGKDNGKPGPDKAEAKGAGKQGPKGTGPNAAGEEKSAPPGKPDEIGEGKGEGKHPGSGDDKHAGASKAVKDLIDQLEKGTPKQKEEAKDKLEQISRNSKDKAERESAASALREVEDKGQAAKPAPKPHNGGGDSAESKENMKAIEKASREIKDLVDKLQNGDKKERKRAEDELEKLSRDARAKADRDGAAAAIKEFGEQPPEQPPSDKSKGDKGPRGKGSDDNNPSENGDPKEKGQEKGKGKGKQGRDPKSGQGNDPGVGGRRDDSPAGILRGSGISPTGTKPDPEYQRRAGELILQKFKDRVTPQMLRDLGITEEEWRKFLASRAESLKAIKPETLPAARRPGSLMPSTGPRAFETTGTRSDPLQAGTRSLPPPELLEGFKRFGDAGSKEKK